MKIQIFFKTIFIVKFLVLYKMLMILFFLLFIISPILIFSQTEGRYFGGSFNDEAFSVVADNDNNFYFVGSVRTFENDFEKVSLFKIQECNSIFYDGLLSIFTL